MKTNTETCGQVQQVVWLAVIYNRHTWLGISLRFISIAFSPVREALWNIHLSTGNSNHVYTHPVYLACTRGESCVVRFHAFQIQTPKKSTTPTTRRWKQHVRFVVQNVGKHWIIYLIKTSWYCAQMNTLKPVPCTNVLHANCFNTFTFLCSI